MMKEKETNQTERNKKLGQSDEKKKGRKEGDEQEEMEVGRVGFKTTV